MSAPKFRPAIKWYWLVLSVPSALGFALLAVWIWSLPSSEARMTAIVGSALLAGVCALALLTLRKPRA